MRGLVKHRKKINAITMTASAVKRLVSNSLVTA